MTEQRRRASERVVGDTDRRRDRPGRPATGAAPAAEARREPAAPSPASAGRARAAADGLAADAATELGTAARPSATADLQRVRRSTPTTASGSTGTGRRSVEQAAGAVLTELLPVLDDIDRAREHGDLTAASRRWRASSRRRSSKLGLSGSARRASRSTRPCTRR